MILLLTTALASGELPRCAESPDVEAQERIESIYAASKAPGGESAVKARVKPLLKIHKKGGVCTAEDHYKVAAVLFQSRDSDTLEIAHQLALVAAHNHIDRGKWLANNSFDRWQISMGRPQRFGTQTGREGSCLYPIDAQFPDDNRVAWGAKSIEDTYAAFLKTRGLEDEPATATTMNRLSLFCRLEAW